MSDGGDAMPAGGDDRHDGDAPPPAEAHPASNVIPLDALAERTVPADGASTAIRHSPGGALPTWMATPEQLEAFRELRTRLLAHPEAAERERFTTLVVPMTRWCGASFVARNLAAAFTFQKRPSLLIECDFHGGGEDEGFGPGRDAHGLFDFLLDADNPSAVVPIWPTAIRGLNVIPSGRFQPQLAVFQREQLSSPAMRDLMERVRTWPCYVFLEAPPIEGSPDARILSELVDFVVLVVGYGRATPREVAKAAALFDRTKFVGAVFNEALQPSAP